MAETVERAGRSGGRAKSLTWKPWGCRSAPRSACVLHGARPPPGAWASRRRAGGRGPLLRTGKWSVAGPRASGSGAAAAVDLRGQRASRRGCPGAGAGTARRCPAPGLLSAPGEARLASGGTATTRVCRQLSRPRPAVFSPGPAPRGGCLCSAYNPASSRRAGGRKARARSPHPGGSTVRLKSQLLSKWKQYWGWGR